MARDEFRDIVESILQGGIQGLSAAQQNEMAMRKELYKEMLKSTITQKMQERTLKGLDLSKYDVSVGPSGITYKPKSEADILKDIQAKEEMEWMTGKQPLIPRTTPEFATSMTTKQPSEATNLIPIEFDKFGRPTKYKDLTAETEELKRKKEVEFDVKKQQLAKDLDSFFSVDDLIDRAEGGFWETRKAGLSSKIRALSQEGIKGYAARTHDAVTKRLRVQLVRAAGDVGNINIVEQQAAEQMVPGFFDSKGSAEIKRAFLKEVTKAINSNDANGVRVVIQKFMETEAYQKPSNIPSSQKSLLPMAEKKGVGEVTLGEIGEKAFLPLKKLFEPISGQGKDILAGPLAPTSIMKATQEISGEIREFAKPRLFGEPKNAIMNFAASVASDPMTYVGYGRPEFLKNAWDLFKKATPRLFTPSQVKIETDATQAVLRGTKDYMGKVFNQLYQNADNIAYDPKLAKNIIQNIDMPKEIEKQILAIGKIDTIGKARQLYEVVKTKVPQIAWKGKTLGKGGLAYKGLRFKNAATAIKDSYMNVIKQNDPNLYRVIDYFDDYVSKNVYPLLERIGYKVGLRGTPTSAPLESMFSPGGGAATEKILFGRMPQNIEKFKHYLPKEYKADLEQLIDKASRVVRVWGKYQGRQAIKPWLYFMARRGTYL
ncbi:MAG: hypothetical protein FJW63_01870 [Actinobacteria bacterium]|nr:hypothetical protein [Actinomycetota bacterium]